MDEETFYCIECGKNEVDAEDDICEDCWENENKEDEE